MKMALNSPNGEFNANTVEKGEITRNKQFLLFPVFSKDLYCRHVKSRDLRGDNISTRWR